jgi:hypothetical protein
LARPSARQQQITANSGSLSVNVVKSLIGPQNLFHSGISCTFCPIPAKLPALYFLFLLPTHAAKRAAKRRSAAREEQQKKKRSERRAALALISSN